MIPHWIAHPEEWGAFALVAVVALVGIYLLWRMTLGGAGALRRAALPPKPYRRVLLPAAAAGAAPAYTDAAVSLACRLAGKADGASLVLTYIIEVPRSLALDAPMPEEEAEAWRALDAAAGAARRCGFQAVTQIRRARVAADETLRAITDQNIDLLVLTSAPGALPSSEDESAPTFMADVARRAPCEVVLARAAQT